MTPKCSGLKRSFYYARGFWKSAIWTKHSWFTNRYSTISDASVEKSQTLEVTRRLGAGNIQRLLIHMSGALAWVAQWPELPNRVCAPGLSSQCGGFLTVWWPQSSQTYMAAQGSQHKSSTKQHRNHILFCDSASEISQQVTITCTIPDCQ